MVALNVGVAHYWLDHAYGALMHRMKLAPPFFAKGWGGQKLELLERIARQLVNGQEDDESSLVQVPAANWPPPPLPITLHWRTVWETPSARLQEGAFFTPCDEQLRNALPLESYIARVALLTPRNTHPANTSCIIHLAGTGDHGFQRRLKLGAPLLKDDIATMVLESPFYGDRRPKQQRGAKLLCVSDLLLLGRATIEETRALLRWMKEEMGFNKLGVCGLSMGGVHAAMVGSLHPTPLAVLPFLAPHSAAVAFCEGILQYGTAWDALMQDQVLNSGTTLEQVRERMRAVLGLTDVTKFPAPKKPEAVIFVSATNDGYIPRHSVLEFQRAWPGSEVRWVTGGHVSSYIFHNKEFRKAIKDAISRL
ncbi:hypothetical protein GOP47_0016204 [Adiantum capillus-veneris]|uniref:Protein ABHD18 n=1 Tax=Adiantum capillus-veneris TaxID=13818 RepID=A0A9D4UI35_ADICA|nr:hypothetical protein GOP47_0016204 [Adiantum capillus-veneris]